MIGVGGLGVARRNRVGLKANAQGVVVLVQQ